MEQTLTLQLSVHAQGHLHIAALWLTLESIRLDWSRVEHVVRKRNVQGARCGWAVHKMRIHLSV
jgi:hypothetical protein